MNNFQQFTETELKSLFRTVLNEELIHEGDLCYNINTLERYGNVMPFRIIYGQYIGRSVAEYIGTERYRVIRRKKSKKIVG